MTAVLAETLAVPPHATPRAPSPGPLPRPLPFIRLVPDCDPPYDDERPEHERTWPPRAESEWVQLALLNRSDLMLPALPPPAFPQPVPLIAEAAAPRMGDCFDEDVESQPSADGLAAASTIVHRYVRAFLEVLSGQRQPRSVAKVVSPEVMDELDNRGADLDVVWAPTLRTVKLCEPVPGVAEVCAVVSTSSHGTARAKALMMRLCGLDGRWVITYASFLG